MAWSWISTLLIDFDLNYVQWSGRDERLERLLLNVGGIGFANRKPTCVSNSEQRSGSCFLWIDLLFLLTILIDVIERIPGWRRGQRIEERKRHQNVLCQVSYRLKTQNFNPKDQLSFLVSTELLRACTASKNDLFLKSHYCQHCFYSNRLLFLLHSIRFPLVQSPRPSGASKRMIFIQLSLFYNESILMSVEERGEEERARKGRSLSKDDNSIIVLWPKLDRLPHHRPCERQWIEKGRGNS